MSLEKAPSSEVEAHSPEERKERVLKELKNMVTDYYSKVPNPEAFDAMNEQQRERAKASHVYIVGYMQALLEANVITEEEQDALLREAKSSASS